MLHRTSAAWTFGVGRGAVRRRKKKEGKTRDAEGQRRFRKKLAIFPMALAPAPARTFSSLKVSQQDVDQAAGMGNVEVRHDKVWLSNTIVMVRVIRTGYSCTHGLPLALRLESSKVTIW